MSRFAQTALCVLMVWAVCLTAAAARSKRPSRGEAREWDTAKRVDQVGGWSRAGGQPARLSLHPALVAYSVRAGETNIPRGLAGARLVFEDRASGILLYEVPPRMRAVEWRSAAGDAPARHGLADVSCYLSTMGTWSVPTDTLVVQFREGTQAADAAALLAGVGLHRIEPRRRQSCQFTARAVSPSEACRLSARLARLPEVLWAEVNWLRQSARRYLPTDPRFGEQWYLRNTGQAGGATNRDVYAELAWDTTRGTSTVVIAVLDDGFDLNHPDLSNNVHFNPGEYGGGRQTNRVDDDGNGYIDDWRGWDFINKTNTTFPVYSDDDHGTWSAGLAVAVANNGDGIAGLAFDCRFLPIRIGSTAATAVEWADAIEYAADQAEVLSIGYYLTPDEVVLDALRYATSIGRGGLGCVVCCAFGNEGVRRRFAADAAAAPEVLSVSACSNHDRRSAFGVYGPPLDLLCPGGGGSLGLLTTDRSGDYGFSTNGYYDGFDGTSAACPLAAGAAALVMARHEKWTGLQVRRALEEACDKTDAAATPYDARGWNEQYGFGRLNVWAALAPSLEKQWDLYEPDGSAGAAAAIADGELQYRSLVPGSDTDWACVTLSNRSDIMVSVVGVTNASVSLYSNAIELAHSAGPVYAHLRATNLAAGTYHARVTSATGAPATNYGLHLGVLNTVDGFEPDDLSGTASNISPREMQYRTLYPDGDVDVARFTLSSNATVEIWTMGELDGDTVLTLRDSGFGLVASNDDAFVDNLYSYIYAPALTAGTYYIELREFSRGQIPSVQLLLEVWQPDGHEPDDSRAAATTIGHGGRSTHTLYPTNDVDWLRFTLTNRANVLIMTDSINPLLYIDDGDTVLGLYTDAGVLMEQNDDGNNAKFSAIYRAGLDPGTYYIKVEPFSAAAICPDYFVSLDVFEQQTGLTAMSADTNKVQISWPGDASFRYMVQGSTNLCDGSGWSNVSSVEGRAWQNRWIDEGWGTAGKRYYRILAGE